MYQRFALLLAGASTALAAACAQSDAGIAAAVKTRLVQDATVKAYRIDVDTDGGDVTLTGTAGTREEAARAVTLARDTSGVRRVVDRLTVGR
jgi:hyperosmotically inducible protein